MGKKKTRFIHFSNFPQVLSKGQKNLKDTLKKYVLVRNVNLRSFIDVNIF